MARLTFPDQQQDLQNAAENSVASECDGSVKFPRLMVPENCVEDYSGVAVCATAACGRRHRFRRSFREGDSLSLKGIHRLKGALTECGSAESASKTAAHTASDAF